MKKQPGNLKGIEGDRIYLIHEIADLQSQRPPRNENKMKRHYIECPKLRSNGMRSTEICFCVCKHYHRCYVVQNIYFKAGYKLTKKKKTNG